MTTSLYPNPATAQQRLPYPPGSLANQVDLSGATADDPAQLNGDEYLATLSVQSSDRADYLKDLAYAGNLPEGAQPTAVHSKVARDLADWHPDAPENGWSDHWNAIGETVAGASYLEQKAKPALNSSSQSQTTWADDPTKTCGKSAIGRFAMTGTDPTGSHQVAKVLMCGREWCERCGKNSDQGVIGSAAHQRRIARWLPKAQQMSSMGEFVLTVPPDLRSPLRDPEHLSTIGRRLTRLMKRYGFDRGLRRWHWFGELDKAPEGEAPVYHPHQNVLVDGRFLPQETLDDIRLAWSKLLRKVLGLDYTPVTDVHYQYAPTAGQMYHRVRYVTRATFKDLQWDEYMGRKLVGFRNAQTWGKWEGEPLWQPEPDDDPPAAGAVAIAAGNCPDCPGESPIEWDSRIIRAAGLERTIWRDLGTGYYVRDLEAVPRA